MEVTTPEMVYTVIYL